MRAAVPGRPSASAPARPEAARHARGQRPLGSPCVTERLRLIEFAQTGPHGLQPVLMLQREWLH